MLMKALAVAALLVAGVTATPAEASPHPHGRAVPKFRSVVAEAKKVVVVGTDGTRTVYKNGATGTAHVTYDTPGAYSASGSYCPPVHTERDVEVRSITDSPVAVVAAANRLVSVKMRSGGLTEVLFGDRIPTPVYCQDAAG